MSLRSTAQTGRDAFWANRGIEEFGGGFLGLFLLKLTEKAEEHRAKREQVLSPKEGIWDRILTFFD